MVQIVIDTNKIIEKISLLFAIVGFITIAIITGFGIAGYAMQLDDPVITIPAIVAPTYPTVFTFTVLSTTTSNGRYQVTTTGGNILYFENYVTWNRMYPQYTYTATLIGMDGIGYKVGTVNLISTNDNYYTHPTARYNDLPSYWRYGGKFYQCDTTACDPMTYKQIAGGYVNEGRPPRPIRR